MWRISVYYLYICFLSFFISIPICLLDVLLTFVILLTKLFLTIIATPPIPLFTEYPFLAFWGFYYYLVIFTFYPYIYRTMRLLNTHKISFALVRPRIAPPHHPPPLRRNF